SRIVHSRSEWDSSMSSTTTPARARSTNPPAMIRPSTMTTCLRPAEYAVSSTAYARATGPKAPDRRNPAIEAPTRRAIPAPSATPAGKRPEETGRGDRAKALLRVRAVALGVHDVVDQVDPAGEEAEDHEGEHGARHERRLVKAPREDQPREDEEVLGPLARAERRDEGAGHRA